MLDNISRVNQSILSEDRINSLRNQKEEIRKRLQNPGLYPERQQQPITTLQQLQSQFRPAQSLQTSALNEMFNSGNDSTAISENTGNSTGRRGGLGFNSNVANIGGQLAGLVGGRMGMGPASGFLSAAVKGVLGDKDPGKDIVSGALKSALFSAVPQLAPAYALFGLSSLFGRQLGFDPKAELASYFNIGNQFDHGFGYVPGMETKQGVPDPESGGLYGGQSFTGGFDGMSPETSYGDMSYSGGSGLGGDYGGGYSSGDNSYGGSSGNE